MKLRRILKWIVFTLLIVGVTSSGMAVAETTDAADGQKGPSDLKSDENLSLIDEDIESLTGQQMLNRGAKKIERMRKTLIEVAELLDRVRDKERDVIKVNCINEKHAAIKGFVKVSEQSYLNLKQAVSKQDDAGAEHHYTLISVARQKVRTLSEEAFLCTGEERRYTGDAKIEYEEPDSGDEDVDVPEDDVFFEDLPELSPFQ